MADLTANADAEPWQAQFLSSDDRRKIARYVEDSKSDKSCWPYRQAFRIVMKRDKGTCIWFRRYWISLGGNI